MKLIKFLICCSLVLIFPANAVYAQTNILNTEKVENIGKKTENQIKIDRLDTPLPYGYTSNDDVLWSKVVWEVIDLNHFVPNNGQALPVQLFYQDSIVTEQAPFPFDDFPNLMGYQHFID